jgi:hypothetical protein
MGRATHTTLIKTQAPGISGKCRSTSSPIDASFRRSNSLGMNIQYASAAAAECEFAINSATNSVITQSPSSLLVPEHL